MSIDNAQKLVLPEPFGTQLITHVSSDALELPSGMSSPKDVLLSVNLMEFSLNSGIEFTINVFTSALLEPINTIINVLMIAQ